MSEISFETTDPRQYVHDYTVLYAERGKGSVRNELSDEERLDFSVEDIERRPESFDVINEVIVAAAEEGTADSLAVGIAAQKLRDEMHRAYVLDVPFRPSLDSEMRDELAEWLVEEVDGLTPEAALKVVSLEGLDFPPVSEFETTETTDSTGSLQAA